MTSLLWETALLLLGAYFLGTFTGCLVRRMFFAKAPAGIGPRGAVAPVPPQRLPDPPPMAAAAGGAPIETSVDVVPVSAVKGGRQEQPDGEAASVPSSSEPVAGLPPAREHARPAQVATSPAASAPAPARDESVVPRPEHSSQSIGTSAAAAAALAAATARHQTAAREKSADPEPSAHPLPATSGTSGQASTVARRVHAPAVSQPTPASPAAGLDDLTRIRAIDAALQKRLNALGVRRFADIAAWREDDVRFISQALGFRGRIERENWIEQAQILMGGSETAFSRRDHVGLVTKPTDDQGDQQAATAAPVSQPAETSGVEEAVAAAVSAAQPRRAPATAGRDNLQRISRVSEDIERLLNAQGVTRYEHVAQWTASDVARFEHLLGNDGRISRENWIEQAHLLAGGGETAYAREFDRKHAASARPRPTQLVEAIREAQAIGTAKTDGAPPPPRPEEVQPRKVDLSTLRSVRSEALVGAKQESAVGIGPGERLAARPDDLKRIRGIGVLFEKRLNGMGFWTYEQIANWTAADVARVSKALEVKGQIERENWVEQARILASGQLTEFARRRDRGEVVVNRPMD